MAGNKYSFNQSNHTWQRLIPLSDRWLVWPKQTRKPSHLQIKQTGTRTSKWINNNTHTSLNLLCLRSSTRSLVRLAKVSGSNCKEFSLRASVCRPVRWPNSDGKIGSLLPYRNSSVSLVSWTKHNTQLLFYNSKQTKSLGNQITCYCRTTW